MDPLYPRAKSCIECRQQKVRCDRLERFPQPCSRCFKRRLQCDYKPVFTRSTARKVTRSASTINTGPSLEACGIQYQSERDTSGSEGPRVVSPNDNSELINSCYAEAGQQIFSVSEMNHRSASNPFFFQSIIGDHSWQLELYNGLDQTADKVTLTPEDINAKFKYFFTKMHPHFPLLPRQLCIGDIITASSLLFWTIIAVASSFKEKSTYRQLQPFVRQLVAQVLHPSGHSVETCQALCILCLWPFEALEPNDDPSYLYAGLATHLALHTGLHRPEFSVEFKNIDNSVSPRTYQHLPTTKWMTWCACKFVEHQLASKTGVPSGAKDDWAFRTKLQSSRATVETSVPPLIKQHLLLDVLRDHFICAISFDGACLSGMVSPESRIGLLKLFTSELDRFFEEQKPLEILSSVLLHATYVMVGGFCLGRDFGETFRAQRLVIVERALTSASSVLDLIAPLSWETLPVHITRAILHAGVFAVQLKRSPSLGIPHHLLDKIIDRAIAILRTLAYGKDQPTRAKIVLEAHRSLPSQDACSPEELLGHQDQGVKFTARMGSNIYWDLVEREKCWHNWNQDAEYIFHEMIDVEVNRMPDEYRHHE